jgi:hypothetical protein
MTIQQKPQSVHLWMSLTWNSTSSDYGHTDGATNKLEPAPHGNLNPVHVQPVTQSHACHLLTGVCVERIALPVGPQLLFLAADGLQIRLLIEHGFGKARKCFFVVSLTLINAE